MFKKLFFCLALLNSLVMFSQPSDLYMVGDATPIGWHLGNAMIMNHTSTNGVFEYIGPLFPGDIKFAVNQNTCWCQDFYVRDLSDATHMLLNGADNKWTIGSLAQYHVVANTNTLTILIEQVSTTPIFTNFWMIGDATSAGWSMDSAINLNFNQSNTNPNEFVYQGSLAPGVFKIFAGSFNNFCGVFYNPLQSNQPFTDISAQLVNNCSTDLKWNISSAGTYKVILNTANSTVTVLDPTALSVPNLFENKCVVYPNPAKDIIYINTNSNSDKVAITIFNLLGEQVYTSNSTVNNNLVSIDASNLNSGSYVINLKDANGSSSYKIFINK